MIELVSSGKVNITKMISKIYPADEAAAAFDSLAHNDGTINKVLLSFTD